jgi:hypothetical protein
MTYEEIRELGATDEWPWEAQDDEEDDDYFSSGEDEVWQDHPSPWEIEERK